MSTIILAAGMGKRLRPHTNDTPKCMVPLFGVPLLLTQISTLKSVGREKITLVGGYLVDQLPIEAVDCIAVNKDFGVTNMVHTLFCAEHSMTNDEDLVIGYGDIVYERSVIEALLACDGEISLTVDKGWRDLWSLRMEDPLTDAETLKMSADGLVTELGKKPDSYDEIQGQYMGLLKVRADKVDDFRAFYHKLDQNALYDGNDFRNMYMTSFIQAMIDSDWEIKAATVTHGWLEVDTSEELEDYELLAKDGDLDKYFSTKRC